MKLKFAKAAAAAVIAGAAIFAPVAANADEYTPVPPAGVTITPGGTVTVPFTGFAPNESVSFTLTGENASGATLAFVHFAVETANLGTKTADADGAVSAAVTLPADASGSYTLTASGETSGEDASATLTVTGETLPATGSDSAQLLGLWIGGGALLLAGGGIAVAATVRRHRNEVAA